MFVILYVLMIVLMYFLSGINKLNNFTETVDKFKSKLDSLLKLDTARLPIMVYQIIIAGVILLEIVAPIVIVVAVQQNKYKSSARYCSIGLAIFTIVATLMYHFPPTGGTYYAFMKNLTATGALLLISKYVTLQNQ